MPRREAQGGARSFAVPASRNADKNAETRAGLAPVIEFAETINAAAFGVSHLSKGTAGKDPLERGLSHYGALPRLVYVTAKNKVAGDGEPERIMTRAKSNIGPDGGGFGFHIDARPLLERPDIEATTIVWEHAIEGTAIGIMNAAEGEQDGKATKLDQAKRFLQTALAKGERPQKDVMAAALAEGISERTLRRAAMGAEIGKSKEKGPDGAWVWWLT